MGLNEIESYADMESEDQPESLERLSRALVMLSEKVMKFHPETLDLCGLIDKP